jgi:hypothetical protein
MPTSKSAWQCVQIADLLRRVEEIVLDSITALGAGVHAGLGEGTTCTLSRTEVAGLKDKLVVASDLSDQLAQLGERLPNHDIDVSYEGARDGAAADLADGILDPTMALLAARVLDVTTGWPALAQALVSTDVRAAWDDVTVEQMLLRSRGATRTQVRQVIRDAGLASNVTFAALPAKGIEALAAALNGHVGS